MTFKTIRFMLLILLLILLITVLSGCTSTAAPTPVLVTLPVGTAPPTETVTPGPVTDTPVPADTPTPTLVVVQTGTPTGGISGAQLLWEWPGTSRPTAVAISPNRLAAIVADGRFTWLDANTGDIQASGFLWPGLLEGESWGDVYTDGGIAVVEARETSISISSGLAETRARLAVFNSNAEEQWSLPQLGTQRFYSAALTPSAVLVGMWPFGFEDNSLAAYDVFTGEVRWQLDESTLGYRQIVHDGSRAVVLVDDDTTDYLAAYDIANGDELWRWQDDQVVQPERIVLADGHVFVVTTTTAVSINASDGSFEWGVRFDIAPEAGFAYRDGLLYVVPAPTAQSGYRPGVVAIDVEAGQVIWNSLVGLVADSVATGRDALWVVSKNYDSGEVALAVLDASTGLEQLRLPVSMRADELYTMQATGGRVYVIGETLRAYGY